MWHIYQAVTKAADTSEQMLLSPVRSHRILALLDSTAAKKTFVFTGRNFLKEIVATEYMS